MCGVIVETSGGAVTSIVGDPDDPLSKGHICPKATALAELYTDPDRLTAPMIRRGDGFVEVSWDEAFDAVVDGLRRVQARHGPEAVGVYMGNPSIHALGAMTHGQLFFRLLKTRSRFSATSLDQLPHMLAALQMFGHQLLVPVPDIDRAHGMVIIGANPLASNGSMMSAPGVKGRLRDIQLRGGRVTVIDPRRTETAAFADEHFFIRPGTDAALLACLIRLRLEAPNPWGNARRFIRDGDGASKGDDVDVVRAAVADFDIDSVATFTGIAPDVITQLAARFVGPRPATAYGRFGVCTQDFGGLTAYLLNVLNMASGALDVEGGVMFTRPAVDLVGAARLIGQRGSFGRRKSRVRGAPAFSGEFPAACLAEEIDTPGDGQLRALITHAGNPVLSTPDGGRLERALPGLEFMVSIDPYVNETTTHAHVILPPTTSLERSHYDLVLNVLAVRNTARYSAPTFARGENARHDWEIFTALAKRMAPHTLDERSSSPPRPPWSLRGRLEAEAIGAIMRRGPEAILDMLLRLGPYRTSLGKLKAHTSGIDFGPLQPCLPDRLQTQDHRIHAAPGIYAAELHRLTARMSAASSSSTSSSSSSSSSVTSECAAEAPSLVLIGRRDLRSNNSWMHNSPGLMRGKNRCTVLMHPDDAAARALHDGQDVALSTTTGRIVLPVEVTSSVMPGVVCVPHGFGHHRSQTKLGVAHAHAGVSVNDVTDGARIDVLTGNASFSGTPVHVEAADLPVST